MSTPTVPRVARTQRGRGRGRTSSTGRGNATVSAGKTTHLVQAASTSFANQTLDQRPKHPANDVRTGQRAWTSRRPMQSQGRSSHSPPRRGRGSVSPGRKVSQDMAINIRSSSALSQDKVRRDPGSIGTGVYQNHMSDIFSQLKKDREKERRNAIKDGFLADPDRPTSLANAITPVGTCQHMCPEFERVERIVQLMVDGCEKSISTSKAKIPDEQKMVKRFRRSAAGYDEQLPSDIRPPHVLQKTLTYLIEEVVGNSPSLGSVHKFVWDRTRSIRNDFSIQQVTKPKDLRVAIDCFERIARFHIVSLHILSKPNQDNVEFDSHQEREQLNNTLLSLMYYYDDSRLKISSPNEAEFRSYCIIFEMQDQRPDLENRAQNWPRYLLGNQRVKTALRIYSAASNTHHEQGPLRPRASFATAQADYGRFWRILASNSVSYLMACVAEIYFNIVRKDMLEAIWKAYKAKRYGPNRVEDWVLDDLVTALGFDDQAQVQSFVETHGFRVEEKEDGERYIDLTSVNGRNLIDSSPQSQQTFSEYLVENKRFGRTLPAVIDGLSVSQANKAGLAKERSSVKKNGHVEEQSLFITGYSGDEEDDSAGAISNSKGVDVAMEQVAFPEHDLLKLDPRYDITNPFILRSGADLTAARENLFRSDRNAKPATLEISGHVTRDVPSSVANGVHNSTSNDIPSASPKFTLAISPIPIAAPACAKPRALPGDHTVAAKPSSTEVMSQTMTGVTSRPDNQITSQFDSQLRSANSSSFLGDRREVEVGVNESRSVLASSPKQSLTRYDQKAFPSILNIPSPLQQPTTFESSKQPDSTGMADDLDRHTTDNKPATIPEFVLFNETPSAHSCNTISEKPANLTDSSQSSHLYSNIASSTPYSPKKADIICSRSSSLPAAQFIPHAPKEDVQTARPSVFSVTNATTAQTKQAQVLNSVVDALVLDRGALLQQFLEYSLGELIATSIQQGIDDKSWAVARKLREVSLARKYSKIWKRYVWNGALLRRGRERRKVFAMSMQELDRANRQRQKFHFPNIDGTTLRIQNQRSFSESPNLRTCKVTTERKRKRISTEGESRVCGTNHSSSRHKRHDRTGLDPQPKKPHQKPQMTDDRSVEAVQLGSQGNTDVGLRIVRDLVSSGRTDTTRTDYFRLKALGIDPDTPTTPRAVGNGYGPCTGATSSQIGPTVADPDKTAAGAIAGGKHKLHLAAVQEATSSSVSDEELFAQMRMVKDAMAESISWFQEECATNKHSIREDGHVDVHQAVPSSKLSQELGPTLSNTMRGITATGSRVSRPPKSKAMSSLNQRRPSCSESDLDGKPSKIHQYKSKEQMQPGLIVPRRQMPGSSAKAEDYVTSKPNEGPHGQYVGHGRLPHTFNVDNRSGFVWAVPVGATDGQTEVNGVHHPCSNVEDGDRDFILGYDANVGGGIQPLRIEEAEVDEEKGDESDEEDEGDEEDENDEEQEDEGLSGEDDKYNSYNQDSAVPDAIWKSNGQLRGATVEDAIEL